MKSFTSFSPHQRANRSKHWLWLMTCFTILLGGINSYAQVHTSIVGTGTGFNGTQAFPCPLGNYYWGTKNQFLVTAGELASSNMGANGEISSIGFNVINTNGLGSLENYVVKIYAVSNLDPIANDWHSGTPVAVGTIGTFTPTIGWNQLELDTPYEWNGTSNLIIETCSNNSDWVSDGNASVEWTSTLNGATFTRWYMADSSFECATNNTMDVSTTTRPNLRFEWTGDLPSCLAPSGLSVDAVTFNSADLSWTSDGDLFDLEFGEIGFIPTGTPSTGFAGITTSFVTLTDLTAETYYQYYVREDCGTEQSLWSGPFTFFTGYCIPTSTWDDTSNRILGFSTTDGYTNIQNENNGVENAYSNYSNMSVTQSPGGTFYYNITVPSYTYAEVWLDIDQNMIFDPTMELIAAFDFQDVVTTFTGTMYLPTDMALGDYRMRIRSRYEWNTEAAPCGEISYSEAEDYTISVVEVPTCLPPSGLAVDGTSFTTAVISWQSAGDLFDVEFGEVGFTPTGTPTTNYSGITTASVTLTDLTAETHYQFYVRQDCGDGDTSLWAGPFTFYTGYCIPTSTWDGEWNRIKGFSTSDGYTNISNENNGISNAYSNFSNMTVTQSPGGSFDYNISVPSWTYVEVWVDLDQNMIFDESMELIAAFEYSESDITFTGSVMIPEGTPYGNYRMRIRSRADWNTEASPCGEISYSEAEDYTLSVVPVPTCLPPSGLAIDGLSFTTADISWQSAGSLFDVEFGETGFTPTGTPTTGYSGIATTSVTLTNLTPETHYQYYVRQDCGDDNTSLWAGPFTFFTGYCIPTSTWDDTSNRITGFSTTEGYTNILNENNGTQNAYSNFSNMSVSQSPGGSFNYYINVPGWTYVEVWLDIDQNMIFDEDMEILAAFGPQESSTTLTGTLMIPEGTPYGDYRLRVRSRSDWNTIASPCGEISYSEAEDYTISVVPTPTCLPPSGLTVDGVTYTTATISWTSAGDLFDVEFGETGFTPTGTPTTGYSDITTTSVTLTDLTPETYYQYYVRLDCGDDDLSLWAGPFPFFTGYCQVSTTFTWDYTSSFSTTGAVQNVNYSADTQPAGSYSNQTAQVIEQAQGLSFDFSTAYNSGEHRINIWVDWNNDMLFDNSEESTEKIYSMYNSGSNQNGTIQIPVTIPVGEYRMRVRSQWGFQANPSPCGEVAYGSTLDFTLSVTAAPSCLPPTNLAASTTQNSATLSWVSDGDLFIIEYGTPGFTPGTGTTVNGVSNPYTINDLTPGGLEYYVRQDCGDDDFSFWVGPYTFVVGSYTGGDIPTLYADWDVELTPNSIACEPAATITIDIPEGYELTGLTTQYKMTARNSAWISEQHSVLYSPTLAEGEATVVQGQGDNAGTMTYNRAVTFANGATGSVDFVLKAWRTWSTFGEDGCSTYNNYVVNGTWVLIPTFEPLLLPCSDIITPTGASEQSLILGQTIAGLTVSGTNLVWYADADLTTVIPTSTVAVNGTTYYVVNETDECQSEALAITVTLIDPCAEVVTPTGDAIQTVAEGTTLAELDVDGDNLAWYADANVTQSLPATTVVESGVTYYVASVTDICQSEPLAITVVIEGTDPCEGVTIAIPTGEATQTVDPGTTLAELMVEGENLQWYADEGLTEALEGATEVEDNTTYYVTQTIGLCTGEALAVNIIFTVGREDFETFAFRFYPNPVGDVLNLTSNSDIAQINLFNMLGQKVTAVTNANNTQVDMSGLPTGNYIISITIEGVTKTFKLVKN